MEAARGNWDTLSRYMQKRDLTQKPDFVGGGDEFKSLSSPDPKRNGSSSSSSSSADRWRRDADRRPTRATGGRARRSKRWIMVYFARNTYRFSIRFRLSFLLFHMLLYNVLFASPFSHFLSVPFSFSLSSIFSPFESQTLFNTLYSSPSCFFPSIAT